MIVQFKTAVKMSVAGSTTSRTAGQVSEAERQELEQTFHEDLRISGVIVFTSFEDKFMFVPNDGLIPEAPLSDMVDINLDGREISIADRKVEFQLIMMAGHEGFPSKVFARVESGNLNGS